MGGRLAFEDFPRAFNDDGSVSPGAQMFLFEAGSTTPYVTYSDPLYTFPQANPIIADASGYFPQVYMKDDGLYKVRILDADDVLLFEADFVEQGQEDRLYAESTATVAADTAWTYTSGTGKVVAEGDYIQTRKEGAIYRVEPSSSTSNDTATAGGVKLNISGDGTAADLVGATDGADPDGREAYAPALVASMQRRRLYGVSLRDLLGRSYNGDTALGTAYDGSAALNGFIPELVGDGIGITDPDSLAVSCESALITQKGMRMQLGPRTRIIKRSNVSRLITRDKTRDTIDTAASISGTAGGYLSITSTVLGGMTNPPAVGDKINLRRCGGTYRYIQGAMVEVTAVAGNVFTTDFYCVEDVSATTCSAYFADWTDDVEIAGGVWGNFGDTDYGGHLFEFFGSDWIVRDAILYGFSPGGGGLGMLFAGDNYLIQNVRAYSLAYENSGTGGFRCVGGRNGQIIGSYTKCGDDALQFVTNTNPENFEYDWDIMSSRYIGCVGESTHARSAIIAIDGPQTHNDCMSRIHDTGHIACSGYGSKTTARISNGLGQCYYGQMDRLFMKDCSFDGRLADSLQAYMMQLYSRDPDGVNRVNLENLNLIHNVRQIGLDIRVRGANVLLRNCRIEAEKEAVAMNSDDTVVTIDGGEYATLDRGNGGIPNHVINQYGVNTLRLKSKPRIQSIAANKAGIRVGAGAVLRAEEGVDARRNANSFIDMTGATQANPCVITAPGHGMSNGQEVLISNVVGMTELNGNIYSITGVTTDTFNLVGINSTGFTAYSSGGEVSGQIAVSLGTTAIWEVGDIDGNTPTKSYGSGALERRYGVSFASAADLADATSEINTILKQRGVQVQDTTNSIRYTAEGPNATSNWQASDGSADIAPS
jgi:hypothetical protein